MKFIANTKDLEKYIGKKIQKNFSIIKGISTDSRSLKKGYIFIAIKGKNFNGNDYVDEALKKGAIRAIVDDKRFIKSKNIDILFDLNGWTQGHRADAFSLRPVSYTHLRAHET